MALTAKSMLLTDENGINISPITNIESLYYETKDDNNIVYRNFIYLNFPVYVNVSNNCESLAVTEKEGKTTDISANLKIVYIENNENKDITISCLKIHRLEGTGYHKIDVSNFNLSTILYNYVSKSQFKNDIAVIQQRVTDLSIYVTADASTVSPIEGESNLNYKIEEIQNTYKAFEKEFVDVSVYSLEELRSLAGSASLYPNTLYELIYYPTNIEEEETNVVSFDLILQADSSCTFAKKVIKVRKCNSKLSLDKYEIFERSEKRFAFTDFNKWDIIYDISTNCITYMKDLFNNSAPFDFKNYAIFVSESGADFSEQTHFINNIVNSSYDNNIRIYTENNGTKCRNNYIGKNCFGIKINRSSNNTILNDCSNISIVKADNNTIKTACLDISILGKNNVVMENNTSIFLSGNNNIIMQDSSDISCNMNNYIGSENLTIVIQSNNIVDSTNLIIKLQNYSNSHIGSNNTSISTTSNDECTNVIIGNNNSSINMHCKNLYIDNYNYDLTIGNLNYIIENITIGNNNTSIKISENNNVINDNNNNISIESNNNNVLNNCKNIAIKNENNYVYNDVSGFLLNGNTIVYSNNISKNNSISLKNCIIGTNIVNNESTITPNENSYYTNNAFYAKDYYEEN